MMRRHGFIYSFLINKSRYFVYIYQIRIFLYLFSHLLCILLYKSRKELRKNHTLYSVRQLT